MHIYAQMTKRGSQHFAESETSWRLIQQIILQSITVKNALQNMHGFSRMDARGDASPFVDTASLVLRRSTN